MHPTVAFFASIFLIWLLVRAAQRETVDNRRLSALVLFLLATVYSLGILDVVLLARSGFKWRTCWPQTRCGSLVVLTARVTLLPRNSGQDQILIDSHAHH